jgi:hypothetical protein
LEVERASVGAITPEDFCRMFLAYNESPHCISVLTLKAAALNALGEVRYSLPEVKP